MHIEYKPKGVCSSAMEIDTAEGRIENVKVIGGCDGNLKGLCARRAWYGVAQYP